ncbi:AAA family ATPase [Spirosoma sordidisoli]|uniref:AAA family ATPase n=1 Tax=Spirosoma sordidisoli TaxID=2502893 RepID=A0A4Q2UBP0_9BACT|nr:AAA family ATPase [Spirosoma sordidisoli]RYC66367.1 AAA family ATPase [Spirosoma sordidisoli]
MQNKIDFLSSLSIGDAFKMNGKTVYLADFQRAGSKYILFVANTPQAAKNPDGLHNFADVTSETFEPLTAPKSAPAPVKPAGPGKAPKRVDFPDTEEGEDEFSEAFGAWLLAKKAADQAADQAADPAPVEPTPAPAEPTPAPQPKPSIKVLLPPTQVETEPGEVNLTVWPDPQAYNSAFDYVAAVKKADPAAPIGDCKTFKQICLAIGIAEAKLANENARRVLIRHLNRFTDPAPKPAVQLKPTVKQGAAGAPAQPAPQPKPAPAQPTPQPAPAEPAQPTPQPAPVGVSANTADVAADLARVLSRLTGTVDPVQVAAMIAEAVATQMAEVEKRLTAAQGTPTGGPVNRVEIKINELPAVQLEGAVHPAFKKVLGLAAQRIPAFLVGPAGSGKSTLCKQVSKALGLPFYAQSVCAQTPESKLLGYMSATGGYVTTIFREAYQNGGVFLLDEVDAGNPNVLAVLNAALSNGFCSFADGMVDQHPDFICVAAANTYGTGANVQYVGRNPLDGAFLDRFFYVNMPYDEALETAITGASKWTEFVQQVRAELTGERVIISPRASIYGAKCIAAGMDPAEVCEGLLIKGNDAAITARIRQTFARYTW